MAVTKTLGMMIVLVSCNGTERRMMHDAPFPDGSDEVYVMPDAAPPPFDAGAPPMVMCHAETDPAMQCAPPPSQCLDTNYLIYYTNGACVDNKCEFETHWLYCYGYGCVQYPESAQGGFCQGGFT